MAREEQIDTTEVKTPDVSAVTGGEPCCASPASARLHLQSCTTTTLQTTSRAIKSHLAPPETDQADASQDYGKVQDSSRLVLHLTCDAHALMHV